MESLELAWLPVVEWITCWCRTNTHRQSFSRHKASQVVLCLYATIALLPVLTFNM